MQQNHESSLLFEGSSVVLETKRLILRKPTLADVKAIAIMANDRRIAENTRRLPYPYTQADAEQFIRAQAQACDDKARDGRTHAGKAHDSATSHDLAFLIELRRDRTPLGLCGLHTHANPAATPRDNVPELGYWLGHRHWGQGYATEATRAVIEHGFAALATGKLKAGVRVTNPASRHILEKCGFRWTGVELHRFPALGFSTPVDRFELDRDIWQSLKDWQDVRNVA